MLREVTERINMFQSSHVNEQEGASMVSFDTMPQSSLEEMVQGQGAATIMTSYDETALCSAAFRCVWDLTIIFEEIQVFPRIF